MPIHLHLIALSFSRVMLLLSLFIWVEKLNAQVASGVETRCFSVELYYHGENEQEKKYVTWAENELASRKGVRLIRYDLDTLKNAQPRLAQIANYFKADARKTPALYGCGHYRNSWANEQAFRHDLSSILRMDVYVRAGCPHCAAAKLYLKQLDKTYPGLKIVYHDITSEPGAAAAVQKLAERYRRGATTVPVFHFCQKLIVGFDDVANTRQRIEKELQIWTYPVKESANHKPKPIYYGGTESLIMIPLPALPVFQTSSSDASGDEVQRLPLPQEALPLPGELPLPRETSSETEVLSIPEDKPSPMITLPVFGTIDLKQTGMPLFTIAIGLVDGFNPCAMWVLVFLLSILVNIKSRWRMLIIACTFVIVSGAVYFMFMAAWLSLFLVVGLLRPVQILLALMAIFVGSVHIKDFFAFKKGLTLSIPDSAKPGIYARVRRVINAEHLTGALLSVISLAIMVNIVELLCTAGLPALYTEILTVQQYPVWENYAYLFLYNVAYMFDDGLMVLIVVLTMQKTRMQESHGRWLKLLSGLVIFVLGLVMLFTPNWLI